MYDDPRHIRRNTHKFYLSDEEMEVLDASVKSLGKQKATLLREWVMKQATYVLQFGEIQRPLEGRKSSPEENPACNTKKKSA